MHPYGLRAAVEDLRVTLFRTQQLPAGRIAFCEQRGNDEVHPRQRRHECPDYHQTLQLIELAERAATECKAVGRQCRYRKDARHRDHEPEAHGGHHDEQNGEDDDQRCRGIVAHQKNRRATSRNAQHPQDALDPVLDELQEAAPAHRHEYRGDEQRARRAVAPPAQPLDRLRRSSGHAGEVETEKPKGRRKGHAERAASNEQRHVLGAAEARVKTAPLENPGREGGAARKSDPNADGGDQRLVRREVDGNAGRKHRGPHSASPTIHCGNGKAARQNEQRETAAHAWQRKAQCARPQDCAERQQPPQRGYPAPIQATTRS